MIQMTMTMAAEMDIDAPRSLANLPNELWFKVLGHTGLSFSDIKAVRLLCRRFAYGPSIHLLYRKVSLSRLRRDVEGFLGIASQPRLAAEVRVIVWHELAVDLSDLDNDLNVFFSKPDPSPAIRAFDHVAIPDGLSCMKLESDIHNTLKSEVFILSDGANQEGGMLPLAALIRAAENMTGLHTLVSQPMHPTRRITHPGDKISYPLMACFFNTPSILLRDVQPDKEIFGFLFFVLPLAAIRRFESPITRLCLSLPKIESFPLEHGPATSFLNLTHLDLCLGTISWSLKGSDLRWEEDRFASLAACMTSAKNLVSLHICFENGCGKRRGAYIYALKAILIGARQGASDPRWKKLRELRLSHCDFHAGMLAKFLRMHASSLKKLHLFECGLTARMLLQIAKSSMPPAPLLLDEFTILQSSAGDTIPGFYDDDDDEYFQDEEEDDEESDESFWNEPLPPLSWVDEKRLVNLMNGAFGARYGSVSARVSVEPEGETSGDVPVGDGDSCDESDLTEILDHDSSRLIAELRKMKGRFVFTHFAKFSSDTWHTGLVYDTRPKRDNVDHLYDREEVDQLDTENGDIRCCLGYSYQSGTSYHPLEDASGRYLPLRPTDNDPLRCFEEDEASYGKEDGEEEGIHEAFDYSGSHDCSDDDFDDGLRWVVARDSKRDIYYWHEQEVEDRRAEEHNETGTDGTGGGIEGQRGQAMSQPPSLPAQYTSPKYKTETWRFWHHSGETAIGTDPLDFWHDWTGPDAGDTSEPLPMGYNMRLFINMTGREEMSGPSYECSTEYILARGGRICERRMIPGSFDSDDEPSVIEEYTNRQDWLKTGWTWSPQLWNQL